MGPYAKWGAQNERIYQVRYRELVTLRFMMGARCCISPAHRIGPITLKEECMGTAVATEDVQQLWMDFKNTPDNQELRNRLIETYLPLVKYHGQRIWSRLPEGVELDDLVSAGVFGLMDAIDAFDLSRGVKFETYCVPRVCGAILDELRDGLGASAGAKQGHQAQRSNQGAWRPGSAGSRAKRSWPPN